MLGLHNVRGVLNNRMPSIVQRAFFSDFFGTDDVNGVMSAYAILSDPTNQYHWNELWRHPLITMRVPPRDDRLSLVLREQSIVSTMPLVLDLVARRRNESKEKWRSSSLS